jgi:hypothetical protein
MQILVLIGIAVAAGLAAYLVLFAILRVKRARKRQSPQAVSREASKKIIADMSRKVAASEIEFERERTRIESKIARKGK